MGRSRALLRALLALAAGTALAAAFAPLGIWPLALLSPALLMWLWQGAAPREAALLGFCFNAGTFAAGTYWLWVSIHDFGEAPAWLALLLMTGLIAIMGLYHAALGYAAARWLPARGALRSLVALPAAWLLVEWWRGWFLSGFAWLSLGYSQTDTPLAGLAPLVGVYGISAVLLAGAGALTALLQGARRTRVVAALVLVVPWLAGWALGGVSWTHPSGAPVSVAVVQGAIPQDEKWLDSNHDTTLKLYRTLTERALGTQLIVWPESAPADTANDLVPYITDLYREARSHGSALVLGVLREEPASDREPARYFNSVLALGTRVSWYDKHHLVPFAEFFPVPHFVRSWLRLMSLPYSDFTPGPAYQPPLPAARLELGATVCYEDAYGSSMLRVLEDADSLVNVTNDAWFGHSTARYQHFQIARMRAREEGRYLIRAANDGVSAIIGPHGEPVARAPEFRPFVLVSRVIPYQGLTPYAHVGNWLVVLLAAGALAYGLGVRNDRRPGTRDSGPAAPLPDGS
ncbi:MAG TPA: apolipoprotein N-acyltransferase [Steroidobacteraceae bacterium]|nr:apolipoprotein N-acyltransferase [Steroidobacteraceae bacterium]